MKILFVCTGNTCRSCMAEGIFNAAAAEDSTFAEKFQCSSAGLAAYAGEPASDFAMKVLQEDWGIDISSHKARYLSGEYIQDADLILTMTRGHRKAVIGQYPEAEAKTFTLKEFAAGSTMDTGPEDYDFSLDITDPYGMSVNAYRRCAREIKDAVDMLMQKLKNSE